MAAVWAVRRHCRFACCCCCCCGCCGCQLRGVLRCFGHFRLWCNRRVCVCLLDGSAKQKDRCRAHRACSVQESDWLSYHEFVCSVNSATERPRENQPTNTASQRRRDSFRVCILACILPESINLSLANESCNIVPKGSHHSNPCRLLRVSPTRKPVTTHFLLRPLLVLLCRCRLFRCLRLEFPGRWHSTKILEVVSSWIQQGTHDINDKNRVGCHH